MTTAFIIIVAVILLAIAFDFINGFHDTANAIATVVATRVLSPARAIAMAAVLNFAGAMAGTAVAKTIASGLVDAEAIDQQAVAAALVAAIAWNLITWYWGIPSSSSHAIIGGVIGAGIAHSGLGAPLYGAIGEKVLLPLVLSPIIGFLLALGLMLLLLRLSLRSRPKTVNSRFRGLQLVSSAFMAFSHGSNDAQKTMGIITLALFSGGFIPTNDVPLWVVGISAAAMGAGTAAGGWRIIRTMGTRLATLQPIHGFAAETAAATIIEAASRFGFPLSTTHVISSAILGVGSARGTAAVRWSIAGNIVTAWIVTIPACVTMGWLMYQVMRLSFRS